MGYGEVKQMHAAEFELNWAIQQAVITSINSQADKSSDASVRRTLSLEERGLLDAVPGTPQPFDPEHATPEEFAAWLAKTYPN